MTSLTLSTISTITTITFNTRNAAWLFSHRRPSYLRVPTSISNPLLDLPIMWTGKFLFFLLDVDQMLRQFAHKRATSNDEKIHRNKKCYMVEHCPTRIKIGNQKYFHSTIVGFDKLRHIMYWLCFPFWFFSVLTNLSFVSKLGVTDMNLSYAVRATRI